MFAGFLSLESDDNKSPHGSSVLLGIPADLTNDVFCMISILLISNPYGIFFQAFVNHSKITSYYWYQRHVPQIFSTRERSKYLSMYLISFIFTQWSAGKQNPLDINFFFFGLLVGVKRSVDISKSQRILCISLSRTDSSLCIYRLIVRSNFNLLHNSQ